MRGVMFFFRDDQLTTQVQVTPGARSIASREIDEPELDRILAADTLGAFSERASRGAPPSTIRPHAHLARAAADAVRR